MNILKTFLNKRWDNTNRTITMSDNVYRTFRLIDVNHSLYVSKQEFIDGIYKISGHNISCETCALIFDIIDKDCNQRLTYQEFVRARHKEMNPTRFEKINQVFNTIDTNKSGVFTAADLDYSKHPDVINGKYTAETMANNYMKIFLGNYNNKDTIKITYKNFMNYYTDLSMTVPTDESFITIIDNAYKCKISFRKTRHTL